MSRTPPDPDEYTVVGCSNCDNLHIVQGCPKTTGCKRCGKRLTFKNLKQFYRTKDKEAAQNARALKLAERNGNAEEFKMLIQSGDLDLDDVRAVTDAEYLQKQGLDPDIADEDSVPDPVDIVTEGIESIDTPTTENIAEFAEDSYGVGEDEIYEAVEKLRKRGDVIQQSDRTLRIL